MNYDDSADIVAQGVKLAKRGRELGAIELIMWRNRLYNSDFSHEYQDYLERNILERNRPPKKQRRKTNKPLDAGGVIKPHNGRSCCRKNCDGEVTYLLPNRASTPGKYYCGTHVGSLKSQKSIAGLIAVEHARQVGTM